MRALALQAVRTCEHADGCTRPATAQYAKHLSLDEYNAIPEQRRPVDGVAVKPVFVCEDHLPPDPCDHTGDQTADAPPCPQCGVTDGPCLTPDGAPREQHHNARLYAPPPEPAPHIHAHRDDCGGHGACNCRNDAPPEREPGVMPPPADPEAMRRGQEILANAERRYRADLLKRYDGDENAVAQHARNDFAGYIAAAIAEAQREAGKDAVPGTGGT